MTPVIAIVGCPNVGKSTLFNRLTRSRAALVANEPGVTRDRQYGYATLHGATAVLIDTGGIAAGDKDADKILGLVTGQTMQAISEADAVIWLVDGRSGLTAGDINLAEILRTTTKPVKPVFLVVNKVDGIDAEGATAEFHSIGGFDLPIPISAESGSGINGMLDAINASLPKEKLTPIEKSAAVKIAVTGRPNVGKSTLVNRMTGENRMLAFASPGTTRDSILIPFQRRQKDYILIDTAGIRPRHRVTDKVEKFSIIKSLKAIEMCQIAILVLDAQDVIATQDQTLLGITNQSGKSLIIAVNKWDGLSGERKLKIQHQLSRKINFIDYACIHHISALHGTGVEKLFDSINKITRSQRQNFKSSAITDFLHDALTLNPPPLVRGRRIKLKYAHLGGYDPVRIIIHGNQTQSVPEHYRRYLSNSFRRKMKLIGTPVFIEFKHGDNPYKAFKNTLTKRQTRKRQRIIRHVKGKR